MSRRRLIILVAVLIVVGFAVVALIRIAVATPPPRPTPPTATSTTATPADPLAWYRSLPDARTMPACPTGIDPDRYFYRNCPTVPASKRSHP